MNNNNISIHPTLQKFREDTYKAILRNEALAKLKQKKVIPFKPKED
jgi:hypothetical protein